MKSAMQELIERYYLFENGEYKPDAFKKHFAEFYPLHLLKEKEQIKTAFASGWNWNSDPDKYYQETYVQQEDNTFKQKSKWTSVDNQKQHIIDIMKADEDDGLYKIFDTNSDKKH
jgi:hypothetical protein